MITILQKALMFSQVVSLGVLYNYFDGSTRLYLAKFLNTLSKPVFSCISSEIFNSLKLNYVIKLLFLNKEFRAVFIVFVT